MIGWSRVLAWLEFKRLVTSWICETLVACNFTPGAACLQGEQRCKASVRMVAGVPATAAEQACSWAGHMEGARGRTSEEDAAGAPQRQQAVNSLVAVRSLQSACRYRTIRCLRLVVQQFSNALLIHIPYMHAPRPPNALEQAGGKVVAFGGMREQGRWRGIRKLRPPKQQQGRVHLWPSSQIRMSQFPFRSLENLRMVSKEMMHTLNTALNLKSRTWGQFR